MRSKIMSIFTTAFLAYALLPGQAISDQTIKCKSKHYQYKLCPIETHGYVYIKKQISDTRCDQGRNWDYDRRGIWVDDGCGAKFVVEDRHHTSGHKDHNGEEAVAAVAALALIAAAASDSDKHDHYDDDNYGHGGHSSYVPRWMIGDFSGYNLTYGTQVDMHINERGRVRANVNGITLKGYVNDGRAYLGDAEFYIDRAGDGFNTTQVGKSSNRVHYSRQ